MTIFPAIDLKDRKCVRLLKGDFNTVHQVADDPLSTATDFLNSGALFLHSVDLDGAQSGIRKNAGIIRTLCSDTTLNIQLGGGIRSMTDIDEVAALGVWRIVIGSAAVSEPNLVRAAVDKYHDRIAVGIDLRDGKVMTHGWTVDSGLDAYEFADSIQNMGVSAIISTDINVDGTLNGPALDSLRILRDLLSCQLIASGGVSSIEDIHALKDLGADGVIIGKAIYSGSINLSEAILVASL